MGFEAGHEKKGGRQKGTPNKKNQEIYELMKEHDANPILFDILVMKGDRRALGYEDRVSVLKREHEKRKRDHDEIYAKKIKEGKENPYPEFEEPSEAESVELNLFPIDVRQKASDGLKPYAFAKRKPIDSDGNDSNDILSDILDAIDGNK